MVLGSFETFDRNFERVKKIKKIVKSISIFIKNIHLSKCSCYSYELHTIFVTNAMYRNKKCVKFKGQSQHFTV